MIQKNFCRTEMPELLEISDVVKEGKGQFSFFFKEKINAKPGQFIMAWLPDVDEKPMAISYHSKTEFAFTSQSVGTFTKALEGLKKGDKMGIRGPYGNSFSLRENACVVAGGVGLSSVSTLIDSIKSSFIIYGARTKGHLIYLKRYKNKNLLISTDDGSFGTKGYTTDLLRETLEKNKKIKLVQTCGPEMMMRKIFDICEEYGVECEASLERYMSCGFGVCGKCMVDDQIVCIDGPIFGSAQLRAMTEFGNYARLKSGKKVSLKEYHGVH